MKKTITNLLFALIFFTNTNAQFYDNTSIFGFDGASIDFLVGLPNDDLDHTILTFDDGSVKVTVSKNLGIPDIWHTNTSFSDKNGKFRFFSDGKTIWNKSFNKEKLSFGNEETWLDNTYNQFNLALPMPNNEKVAKLIYGNDAFAYFLTGEVDSLGFPIDTGFYIFSKNLYHTDINLEKPNDFISNKVIKIIDDSLSLEKFTATRHANGRDWWILAGRANISNVYHTLLLDDKGLHYIKKQTIGIPVHDGVGQVCFSPNGKMYARLESFDFKEPSSINIYDFDRCSGTLSNPRLIKITPSIFGGLAISPNSRFLYFANFHFVYQYDLWADNIEKSVKTIATMDSVNLNISGNYANYDRMQLMPDRRIYVTSRFSSSDYFHIIEKPDLPYPHCDFRRRGLKLPSRNIGSVPNFPNYRLGPLDGSPCDTLGINNVPRAWYRYEKDTSQKTKVTFTDLSFYEPKQWLWDFGDGTTMSKDTSPIHIFAQKGIYKVCLTVKNEHGQHKHCKEINLGNPVSNNDLAAENQYFQLYPNPANQEVKVILAENTKNGTIVLKDITGKTVLTSEGSQFITLPTYHLQSGVYFCQVIIDGNAPIVKKLIIQH